MARKKQKIAHKWFLIGLLSALIGAPNALVIRYNTADADPFLFNLYRMGIVALLMVPFILIAWRKFTARNTRYALLAGTYMTIAVLSYVWAISQSAASYVGVITLITPLLLIFFTVKMIGERITPRIVSGVALAAIGAVLIVVLPLAVGRSGDFVFYPAATLGALINAVSFALATIYYRKANEAGMPIMSLTGITAIITTVVCSVIVFINSGGHIPAGEFNWWLLLYSGAGVSIGARVLNIMSYEHVGGAITGVLGYIETFLAILLPVLILSERVSIELALGGLLVLAGVYVAEYHKSSHHKHSRLHAGH